MLSKVIEFEDVEVRKEENELVIRGDKGELRREFRHPKISVDIKGNSVEIKSEEERKKIKAIIGTWHSIITNMIEGVKSGYEAKLRLIHSHFPAKMELKDNSLLIHNFLGSRKAIITKYPEDIELKLDKNEIIVTGLDKERVGQIAGKIENATRIKKFDRRVFQDGCYIIQKPKLQSSLA